MRIKVLFVSHWDWTLYNFRMPLARALQAQGHDVVLVCPFGEYARELQAAGFRMENWRLRRRSLNPVYEALAIVHLARLYVRERPDVVHHITIKPCLYGSLAALIPKIPTVINAFLGLGFLFSETFRARILRIPLLPILRFLLHRPNSVAIFLHTHDSDLCVRLGLLEANCSRIIPESVDVARFRPRLDGDKERSGVVVLMAARLLIDKGIGEFVSAARIVRERGIDARFWVAGSPDRGNPACISDSLLDTWRRDGVVEFLGHREDMPGLLRRVDIAVLPSYHEGMPRFLLEAAASGLPLVATDVGGCRIIVRHAINGFLVPSKDSSALAHALIELITDPARRARMGQASRKLAVQEFSENLAIRRHLEFYQQLNIV